MFDKYVDYYFELKRNSTNPVERGIAKLMLNALYGRFGMKDIYSNLRIISKIESEKLDKFYNFTIHSDIGYDKVLVKYNTRIPEKLRLLLKDDESENNSLNELGLVSVRGVPSAVQIAAAISGYARMSINSFKNIKDNLCFYSDTDSVVLQEELASEYVGLNLGQMKLEFDIEEGIIIREKLYALRDKKGKNKIAASGGNKKMLTFNNFKELLEGKEVITNRTSFKVNWRNLNVNVVKEDIKLKGKKIDSIDQT